MELLFPLTNFRKIKYVVSYHLGVYFDIFNTIWIEENKQPTDGGQSCLPLTDVT